MLIFHAMHALSEKHLTLIVFLCDCFSPATRYITHVSTLRTATGAKTLEVATREAPIDLEGALNAVKADAVAATERTARENFMVEKYRGIWQLLW